MNKAQKHKKQRRVLEECSPLNLGRLKDNNKIHSDGLLHPEVDVFVVNHYGLLLHEKGLGENVWKWNHIGGHMEESDGNFTLTTPADTLVLPEVWRRAAMREFEEEVGLINEENPSSRVEVEKEKLDDLIGLKESEFQEVGCYRRHTQFGGDNNNRLVRVFLLTRDIREEQLNHTELKKRRPDVVRNIRYFRGLELAQLLSDPNRILGGTPYVLSSLPSLHSLLVSRCLLWPDGPRYSPFINTR